MQSTEPKDLNDDDLVASILDGGEDDFAILYDRYFKKVYGYAYQWLRCRGCTEAVVQEIFTSVLVSLGTFEARSSLPSWIFGIVRNRINNWIPCGQSQRHVTLSRVRPQGEASHPVDPPMWHFRVLLAEDHAETRERVAAMIAPEFEVVGQVCDGEALLSAARLLNPDLIVLDISMPNLSGTDAADHLVAMGSPAKLVFLTVHEEMDYVMGAFSVGARAYVVKSRLASDLLPAMRRVISGGYYLSPGTVGGAKAWIGGRTDP